MGLAITGKYVKKVTALFNSASSMQETFGQYAKLLEAIENESFSCDSLKKQQKKIQTEGAKASALIQNYTKAIDQLAQRNNLLLAFPFNGFLLWDLMASHRVEKWLVDFRETVEHWFEVVEFFDAINSMGNYAYNNPGIYLPTSL